MLRKYLRPSQLGQEVGGAMDELAWPGLGRKLGGRSMGFSIPFSPLFDIGQGSPEKQCQ